MYVVAIRSLIASLRGRRHAWDKLQRSANVSPLGSERLMPQPVVQPVA
jgi:hypothetical protein